MDLDVVFLGTSASMPTAQRGTPALLIRRGGERLLVDCGEGTQRQLLRSSIGLIELREVFLTHYHADHYLGLPGMLKTFALRGRDLPLTIYGPPGLRELFGALRRVFGKLSFPLDLVELAPGADLERDDYTLRTFGVEHGVSAVGYALIEDPRPGRFDVTRAEALGIPPGPERGALQRGETVVLSGGRTITPDEVVGPKRPGRTLVIAGDGVPSRPVLEASQGADVLIHEATFAVDESERAAETLHSTALAAAELARVAGVKLLALTHLSSRYFGPELAQEAREVFPDTVVPRDFDVIEIPYPDAGREGPALVKGGAAQQRDRQPDRATVP
jgi:ribonuclease Z